MGGQLHIFEPPVLVALLKEAAGTVDPACPFAPLVASVPAAASATWHKALEDLDLLDDDELDEDLRRALRVIARPRKRIELVQVTPTQTLRAFSYGNGADVALATFGDEKCGLSSATSLTSFVQRVMLRIGPRPAAEPSQRTFRMDALTFGVIGELIGAGLGSTAFKNKKIVSLLKPQLPVAKEARAFVDALVEDGVLCSVDRGLAFSGDFLPWVTAVATREHLSVKRLDLPRGRVPERRDEVTAMFFGAAGARLTMIPSGQRDGAVLLLHPDRKDLRDLLGLVTGEAAQPNLMSAAANIRL